ncbi:hypothetical protein CLF_107334, partial [Clonorchis sinensis]
MLHLSQTDSNDAIASTFLACFSCGNGKHLRSKYSARESFCHSCGKKRHFQKVCRSKPSSSRITSSVNPDVSSIFNISSPIRLFRSIVDVIVNNIPLHALIDTGGCESYVSSDIALKHGWTIASSKSAISMASPNLSC